MKKTKLKQKEDFKLLTNSPPVGIFLAPLKEEVHVDYNEPPGRNKPPKKRKLKNQMYGQCHNITWFMQQD